MGPTDNSVLALARSILRSSEQLVEYLEQQQHPLPSFDLATGDPPITREYDRLRAQVSDAATDLVRLVNGPKHYYRHMMWADCDLAALQTAAGLGVFESVPENETRSLADLTEATGVDEARLGQVMRFLAAQRVFEEVEVGVFRHTPTSLVAARDEEIRALLGYMLEDVFRACPETLDWTRASPHTSSNTNCPLTQRYGMPLYEYLGKDTARAARFARAMGGAKKFDRPSRDIIAEYPWGALQNGKVVDVGGGSGHISMGLAEKFPTFELIVQDISLDMLAQGPKLDVYSRVQNRVTFSQYDFFTPQPVDNADAFILRSVTHNWNDDDLIRIFRAFIPALEKCRPGTPLLINDTLLPELGAVTRFEEHNLRQMDMLMLVLLGSKQRSVRQFRELLETADSRFEVVKVTNEGMMGLMEVHLRT